MIGCNSTDEELEERERQYTIERENRLKELEEENQTLREEVRTLEAEKLRLETLVFRMEAELDSLTDGFHGGSDY